MTLIKSISGIRGTIGGPATENLTPLDIVKFTTAYVRFIAESAPGKRLKIVVGRDARISGEMVGDIIEGTLLGCGAEQVETGRKKVGAMLGDRVEVGCNSVLNPGTVIGRHSNIYPVSCVRGVIPADSILKSSGEVVHKK